MSDEDVAALVRAERAATGQRLSQPPKTCPKTHFKPPEPKREQQEAKKSAPFVPVNPQEARVMSARGPTERFIGIGTPFESDREQWNTERINDEQRRGQVGRFVPSCSSKARDTIRINYYLNSPMSETGSSKRSS